MFRRARRAVVCFLLLIDPCVAATLSYDLAGNQTSQQASVAGLPVILAQPANQLTTLGGRASFSVVVASPSTATYQWKRNNTAIPGATGDSHVISAAAAANEGTYTVTITNATGPVTSAAATLYLDSNDNGLPDTWETATFGNLTQTGMGDFDADGVSNLDEYLEGTNAASNASLLPRLTTSGLGGVVEATASKAKYTYGESVSLKALPHPGNGFFGWSGALTGDANPAPLAMTGSKTIGAVFNRHGVFAWGYNINAESMVPQELTGIVQVAGGGYHSLALRSDGTVTGWGYNGQNQLNAPADLTGVVQIAAGERHSVALKSDGTLTGWGRASEGQITFPAGTSGIARIAAGQYHTLGLRNDGTVTGWGYNYYGQLTTPTGLNTATAIATGERHSVALRSDGSVVAWGTNADNQLAIPAGLTNVVAIAAGTYHSLALRADGTVAAWGYNGSGQTTVPAGLSGVVGISAGVAHSMALKSDGTLVVWGDNSSTQRTLPPGVVKAAACAAGANHGISIAALEPASPSPVILSPAFALGVRNHPFHLRVPARNQPATYAASGLPAGLQMDPASGLISGSPTESGNFAVTISATNTAGTVQKPMALSINLAVPIVTSVPSVIAVGPDFSHQVTVSNGAATFSATGLPQGLAIDSQTGRITGTAQQLGIFTVTVAATNTYGSGNQVLTLETKAIAGWGYNANNQTVIPSNLGGVIAIAAGESHSLALRQDGTVAGWGNNANNRATPPTGLIDAIAISAGRYHSVALRAGGTVVGWGQDSSAQATPPAGLSGVSAIAAGGMHTLALKTDGTITGWGANSYGQATPPAGLNTAVAIAAGYQHSLALKSDGTVVAWGYNGYNQTTVPAGLNNVVAIAAGGGHCLALKADGTIATWGYSSYSLTTVPAAATNVVAIAAGDAYSLALKSDGSVIAWGNNGDLQTTLPAGLSRVAAISAGYYHGLALSSLEPGVSSPIFTSPRLANGVSGHAFHHRIFVRNGPATFAATGLPAGLTLNPTTGVISGTANTTGSFAVTLSATNTSGTVQRTLNLIINGAVPVVTSAATAVATVGNGFSYQVTASNTPTSFGADGLPPGLTINPQTGLISGAARQFGIFAVTVTATNAYGKGTRAVSLETRSVVAWGENADLQAAVPSGLESVIALAGGYYHSLALKADGKIAGWGFNGNNQVTIPAGLTTAVAIAAGERHSLALKADGTVVAWGYNSDGQSTVPADLSGVVAIAAHYRHSLALKSDGTIRGWGLNNYGQLNIPAGLNTVVAIATGERHSIALKANGTVVAWGNNGDGQLNIPAGLSDVVAISAAAYHSLALKANGAVVAWGYSANNRTTVPAAAQSGVIAIAANGDHNLALKSDRSVVTWGYNGSGQTTLPTGLNKVAAIAAGDSHSLAIATIEPGAEPPSITSPAFALGAIGGGFYYRIAATQGAYSYAASGLPAGLQIDPATGVISGSPTEFGTFTIILSAANASGVVQKTVSLTINRPQPAISSGAFPSSALGSDFSYQVTASNSPGSFAVTGLPAGLTLNPATGLITGKPLVAGLFNITISATNAHGTGSLNAPLTVHEVLAWGDNRDGQTVVPPGLNNVVAVAGGYYHSLALKGDGTVTGWGYNGNNQTTVPASLTTAVAIAAGERHSLALRNNGTVVAWGYNSDGQSTVPTDLSGVVALAANYRHSLALKSDGTVRGWGYNGYGQLTIPAGLNAVVSIATGDRHSIALKADGTVTGWGNNTYNQLAIPVGLADVTSIAAGGYHNLALTNNGSVVAWGYNTSNQATVPVAAQSGVVRIAAGETHSMALKADGTLVIWGGNGYGQITGPTGIGRISDISAGELHSVALAALPPANPEILVFPAPPGLRGGAYHWQVSTRHGLATFATSGLPDGLVLNPATGVISGVPTVAGTFPIQVSATDAFGTSQVNLALSISDPVLEFANVPLASGEAGTPFGYRIETVLPAENFQITGLPPGLSFDPASRLLDGIPSTAGVFTVQVQATTATGNAVNSWTITIIPSFSASLSPSGLTFTRGGTSHWYLQSADVPAGSPLAARSGSIGNNSVSWIETTLPGPGTLAFRSKVSSEAGFDLLRVRQNGTTFASWSGERDWTLDSFNIGGQGPQTIRWEFANDSVTQSGLNAAFLANVIFTPAAPPSPFDSSLSPSGLTFSQGGQSSWYLQSTHVPQGIPFAARSGNTGNNTLSWIETTLPGPGTLAFRSKVSSESNYDFLRVRLNGVPLASWSGERDWTLDNFEIGGVGPQVVRWEFATDGSGQAGLHAAFLAQVTFTPSTTSGGFESWPVLATLPANRRGQDDRNGPLNLPNILAYALGINPLTAQASDLPQAALETLGGSTYLTFTFRKNPAATDITYIPEISASLPSPWQSGAGHLTVIESTPTSMKVRSNVSLGSAQRRFVRLRVEKNL
ncbi:putative Ig domain-containing protein [Luteolibacter arcticus]|uniref:Ig domain-containing protein n=1 Tax=Luteolibacter arcticus TaxID=1581411 RepID=A0ABT3GNG2_9BACT|nr:putative Ig domain-containing protein [Luteolibacter arcticus]MCW1925038.1 putative Ig domain-containing protein [Luteolibacter arcticus]